MGKIVVSTNVTLDGISQDPTGDEDFEFGGWFNQIPDADREAWVKAEFDEALSTDAVLLGGRSYEWFAERWVGREGAWGERLQSLPKYVVRSTDGRFDWGPTTVRSVAAEADRRREHRRLRQLLTRAGITPSFASCPCFAVLQRRDTRTTSECRKVTDCRPSD